MHRFGNDDFFATYVIVANPILIQEVWHWQAAKDRRYGAKDREMIQKNTKSTSKKKESDIWRFLNINNIRSLWILIADKINENYWHIKKYWFIYEKIYYSALLPESIFSLQKKLNQEPLLLTNFKVPRLCWNKSHWLAKIAMGLGTANRNALNQHRATKLI